MVPIACPPLSLAPERLSFGGSLGGDHSPECAVLLVLLPESFWGSTPSATGIKKPVLSQEHLCAVTSVQEPPLEVKEPLNSKLKLQSFRVLGS